MKTLTKQYGVQCIECEKFIEMSEYQTQVPESGPDVDLGGLHVRCPHCGTSCVYANSEVVHQQVPS